MATTTVAAPVSGKGFWGILLRIIFWILLLVIIAGTLAFFWFYSSAHKALPQLDGTISLPGLQAPVSVVRDSEGTIFVSDRDADPSGVRAAKPGRQRTGCVFGIEVGADGRPAHTEVVAAGPELETPGALLATGPLLLLMDADANPQGLHREDGRLATPGVLFDLLRLPDTGRLVRRTLHELMIGDVTTSPVGLIEHRRGPGEGRPLPPPDPNRGPWTPPRVLAWQLEQVRLQNRTPELYLIDAN